jgi:capsular exopolysaccharide synthesis family protein
MTSGGMRTVAVTSSSRGEGKTFTAANLSIARASHGMMTLLIDADLKGRGVSKFLKVPDNRPGLTELLTKDAEINRHIQCYHIGSGSMLYVLSAGAGTTHSAELLESDRFRTLLEGLKRRFDLVVVDTPPLNVVADAAAVTSRVDGVVLVVRGGVTDRGALELTLERLKRIGAHTAGIVFNDAELPSSYRTYSHVE